MIGLFWYFDEGVRWFKGGNVKMDIFISKECISKEGFGIIEKFWRLFFVGKR